MEDGQALADYLKSYIANGIRKKETELQVTKWEDDANVPLLLQKLGYAFSDADNHYGALFYVEEMDINTRTRILNEEGDSFIPLWFSNTIASFEKEVEWQQKAEDSTISE